MDLIPSRRGAVLASLGLGAGLALAGCAKSAEGEVSAVEDLMREHGVLRRILIVYRETAPILRADPAKLDLAALGQAAQLFRVFGEDYHERRLEEQHIFPAVAKTGGEAAGLVSALLAQHQRGRAITVFIEAQAARGRLAPNEGAALAGALESFARMYEAHTAFEDTIVFQAWRQSLSAKALDEAGDQFEDIERAQFKGDGFDMAVDRIAAIEQRLGLHDLGRYTAPQPATA
jgi:hemerythrin-like domain-containing protein